MSHYYDTAMSKRSLKMSQCYYYCQSISQAVSECHCQFLIFSALIRAKTKKKQTEVALSTKTLVNKGLPESERRRGKHQENDEDLAAQ